MKNLSASQEDYLEIICNLQENDKSIKAVEVAKKLNISRASVSEALLKLQEKNLIIYQGHKGITITDKGLTQARKVIAKHNTLTSFFENTLGINTATAESNACRIEHVITDDVFERIEAFQIFCNENKEFIEKFKEKYNKDNRNEQHTNIR